MAQAGRGRGAASVSANHAVRDPPPYVQMLGTAVPPFPPQFRRACGLHHGVPFLRVDPKKRFIVRFVRVGDPAAAMGGGFNRAL